MKKLLILSIFVFLASAYAIPSFAAAGHTNQNSVNGVNQIILGATNTRTVKLSAGVNAQYAWPDGGASYSAATYSTKGNNKEYGLANSSSNIYYKSNVTAIDAGTSGGSTDLSGWAVLGQQ